jgi:hypothetical protein
VCVSSILGDGTGVSMPTTAQDEGVLNVTLTAFMTHGAQRPATWEELKVRTVHRGRY